MEKLSKLLLFGYALALSLISSCVSKTDELDLNKDINLDMHIAGDGISIPFGDLKKIYLDSLIDIDDNDPDALIKKIDGAQYGISMNDDIEKTTINIDPITLSIANPSIDPFVVNFDNPVPDNVSVPRTSNNSSFSMEAVNMSTINSSLPTIKQSQKNDPMTVEGLPEIIEFTYRKEVDLGGGNMQTIEKTFKVNAKEEGLTINPDGTFSDFDYDVVIDTTINGIEIPTIRETITVKGSESPIKVPNTTLAVTIPTVTTSCGFVYNSFPADVEKINYITFANPGSSNPSMGQLIQFDIDLKEVDNMFFDPQYRIKNLTIEFPTSFELKEDPNYQYNGQVINKNKFVVTMGADQKLPVQLISGGHTVDPAHPTVIPVSFYLQRANLNQGPDVPNGTVMTFNGDVKYDVEFEIKGVPNLIGSKDIDMSMGIDEKISLNDMSVNTKRKIVDFNPGVVSSTISVDGLDDVSMVNNIFFNSNKSKIFLSISNIDIDPFNIDVSNIRIDFPSMYHFLSTCTDSQGNTLGKWNANSLTLLPGAIGKTVELKLSYLELNRTVDASYALNIPSEIMYSGNVEIAPKQGLSLNDLGSLGDKECKIEVSGNLDIKSAEVVTSVINTKIADSTVISIDEKVDDALILVKNVDLINDANVGFKMKFEGMPSSIDSLKMRNFVVEFPSFINLNYIGTDTKRIRIKGNKLIINGTIKRNELSSSGTGFVISGLAVSGMSFSTPLRTIEKSGDRYLSIKDSKVHFSGDVRVENQSVSSDELNNIMITPTVSIGDLRIKSFIGKVFPKIDPIHESVSLDLDDDMDFLQNGANSLALSDPQILLKLTSTFSVPVNLNLSLSSKESDGTYIGRNIKPDNGIITLPACPRDQENNTTTIVIYKNDRVVPVSNDSIFVQMSRLSDLMTTIPDSIIFNLEAKADTSMTDVAQFHYADITKELSVSGSYDVTIPLKFDSLYIEYNDTINEMAKDLEDFADKVTNLHMKLVADVYSTVPLGVEVSAVPLDLSGEEITSGITISSCKIAAGTEENAVMSELNLDVMVTDGKLSILDGLIIKAVCKADQTENGTALRSDEYLEIKNVRFEIVDGIDIDLTDKKK